MKKSLFLLFVMLSIFISCNNETPVLPNETIDEAILGMWQVDFSQTIRGVRMRPNGTLEIIREPHDTTTFLGVSQTPITSSMFGRDENIIEIRNDNMIKIYLLNSRGGVTISDEQASYFVRNDTLFRQVSNSERPHFYRLQNDMLIIERIPNDENSWTYTISRYFKTNF
jgi:hypothetical protein